jgi:hypothetical protein
MMKLSLLLLPLLPVVVQASHLPKDAKEKHERSEKQFVRRVQLPEVLPTIAGFIQNDPNLSFVTATVNRIVNGDPIDEDIIATLYLSGPRRSSSRTSFCFRGE